MSSPLSASDAAGLERPRRLRHRSGQGADCLCRRPDRPVLFDICLPLRDLLHRPRQATDAMFVEGIQVAIAAHLLANYTIDRWRPPEKSPSLDPRRLQRVLDYMRLRSPPTFGSRKWRPMRVSAPSIFPGYFAKRPDSRRTATSSIAASKQRGRNSPATTCHWSKLLWDSASAPKLILRVCSERRRVSLRDSIANSAAVRSIATLITGAEDSHGLSMMKQDRKYARPAAY